MNRRITATLVGTLTVTVVAGAGLAPAAIAKRNEIRIVGGPVYKPNKLIGDSVRFKGTTKARSGATVRIVNKANPESGPHTISLIKKALLPRTLALAEPCFEFQGICAPLITAHQVNVEDPEAPPGMPLYNTGAPGFETEGDATNAGDSIVINPGEGGSIQVTAARGTTLSFFCAVHPWMLSKIKVD